MFKRGDCQMAKKRRKHSNELKARVALEAVKGVKTLSELSSRYGVHPTVIAHWKRQLLEGASGIFGAGNGSGAKSEEELTAPLYEEIGRLKVEVDWLRKKLWRRN
jgi:transposase-like protein